MRIFYFELLKLRRLTFIKIEELQVLTGGEICNKLNLSNIDATVRIYSQNLNVDAERKKTSKIKKDRWGINWSYQMNFEIRFFKRYILIFRIVFRLTQSWKYKNSEKTMNSNIIELHIVRILHLFWQKKAKNWGQADEINPTCCNISRPHRPSMFRIRWGWFSLNLLVSFSLSSYECYRLG